MTSLIIITFNKIIAMNDKSNGVIIFKTVRLTHTSPAKIKQQYKKGVEDQIILFGHYS